MSGNWRQAAVGFKPGDRVGGYLLQDLIGHGGMAAVFKARDERLGRLVALKVLAPSLAVDESFRQRFIRESQAAAAVDDPHIIPLFDAGQAGDVLFIAMRYVPGGDVRSLLSREGPLPVERTAAIISPVASALDAAHAAGLVHRDIKPANMLLDTRPGRPDHVYLSDFGLSKNISRTTSLTGTGLFLGTVDYAAPEQIDGRAVDGRADQYALACAAFEMLTGQPPFPRDQALAVLSAHLSQPPPLVSACRAGLSAELDAVFARALAKSPDDRHRNCGMFSDSLRDAAGIGRYDAAPGTDSPTVHRARAAFPASTEAGARDTADTESRDRTASATPAATIAATASARAGKPGAATLPALSARASGQRGNAPPRRAGMRWLFALVAAGAVAAAAAAVVLILAARHGPGIRQASSSRGPVSSSPITSTPTSATSASPATPTPASTWTVYHDPSGFSIDLPTGSAVSSRSSQEVKFAVTPAGFVVVVAWSYHPAADALADWRRQAAAKAAADPTYQQIRVQGVTYRGYDAADWEFTNMYQGVLTHVVDRTFIVQPGHLAYAVELYGPDSRWTAASEVLWPKILASFEPQG